MFWAVPFMKKIVKIRKKHNLKKSMISQELNFPNYKIKKQLREQNFMNSNFEFFSIPRVWQKFPKWRYLFLAKLYSLKVYLWKSFEK